jgi:hypothetical protein
MNPDDPNQIGSADRSRINVEQDYEVRYWSERFHVSPEELRRAVKKVGPMLEAVRRELGTRHAARAG